MPSRRRAQPSCERWRCDARLPYAAQRNALIGQALVGIVGPQGQAVLGPRGEHPIGLGDPACHEIIDHHAEIAIRPVEHDRIGAAGRQCGIQAGHDALRRRLFIAGGAVDLSGQEQARQALGLQGRIEFAGIDMVVFDGIARPDHLDPLEAREWSPGSRAEPLPAARSRCRWDRPWSRRAPPAPGRSGGRRGRRTGRSCPRSRDNSAARCS